MPSFLDSGRTASAVVLTLAAVSANASVFTYSVTFDDSYGVGASFYSTINSHIGAALQSWGRYLRGDADFDVSVQITDSIPRATGGSTAVSFLYNNGVYDIYESGMAYELRTGIDPNGASPDIKLQFNPTYLNSELWFDPDPYSRLSVVPASRTDALSVLTHEFGHALGFNGWGDLSTGALPGSYASTWDEHISSLNGNLFFTGATSTALYGAPIAVTASNNFHIGNSGGIGADLVPDLMNGVVYYRGSRYSISTLDVAMLQDMGLPVQISAVPEPSSIAQFLGGLIFLSSLLAARARRQLPLALLKTATTTTANRVAILSATGSRRRRLSP